MLYKFNRCPHCGKPLTMKQAKKISDLFRRQVGGSRSPLPEGWVSMKKVCDTLNVCRDTVMGMVNTGEITAYRIFKRGKRIIYGFRKEDLGID